MSRRLQVLLLAKYGRLGASSRLRSYQYLPFLEKHDIYVEAAPLLDDAYVSGLYSKHIPWDRVVDGYVSRVGRLMRSRCFDLLWLEKELFPWMPAFIEFSCLPTGVPLVVDFDDAVFHLYDQNRMPMVRWLLKGKIDQIMRRANAVVAGSDYLVERAKRAGARRIEKLPTVVDLARYPVAYRAKQERGLTIGWIGSPGNSRYLLPLLPVLREAASRWGAHVVAIGAAALPEFDGVIDVLPWTEDSEVRSIQEIDIGIMPLPNEPFERGKCGYKLIQYMACGKPVIATPLGENMRIIRPNVNGILAEDLPAWRAAFAALCSDEKSRFAMGAAGRHMVEATYSLGVTAPCLARLIRELGDA